MQLKHSFSLILLEKQFLSFVIKHHTMQGEQEPAPQQKEKNKFIYVCRNLTIGQVKDNSVEEKIKAV